VRQINKILFITLSNIGDCILTLPVLDELKAAYPGAAVTVLSGPRPQALFYRNPAVSDLVVYDKHCRFSAKISLMRKLASERYDLVVDMRNSLLGLLLPAAMRTFRLMPRPHGRSHMKNIHLAKISCLHISGNAEAKRASFPIRDEDRQSAADMLKKSGFAGDGKVVVISAGARSPVKRWSWKKFVQLIDNLVESFGVTPVLIGDSDDMADGRLISENCRHPVIDLTGRTTLSQAGALLQKASLLITNDSANLHLASYMNVPVLAIFGPTDDAKYGPWSEKCAIAKKEIFCRPCRKAQCRFGTMECMQLVTVDDVLSPARRFLEPVSDKAGASQGNALPRHKRILIVRNDRMGDVILSTPVFKAVRDAYPHAYIAVMVRPYTRAVVQGNPYIDEVIVFDKKEIGAGIFRFIGFIAGLRRRRFDLAIVLHPTNRDHLMMFLSNIKKRVGYDRKMGFLLTDRMSHDKHKGRKHESEYALDMLRFMGLQPREKEFIIPVDRAAEQWADALFLKAGIKPSERTAVINPGASCPSKIWPAERYAAVADALVGRGFKTIVLAGPDELDQRTSRSVMDHMKTPAMDLIGKAGIPQTASLFRRCSLVISADTGPMHIAAAVGVPLIAIFGRNQPGISPKRWGPMNSNSVVLHKDVGCIECLAHDCIKGFACLAAISVEDVMDAADKLAHTCKK
jgi:heptosyltransferase II